MPYNNTPITPANEITGTVSLPLARVKKIIATDDEISNCSNNAAFVITVAAEMFLQHLVEQSYNIVKSDHRGGQSKPRRNVQYRDVANAVSRVENLEFLTDVVPKTTTYRQFKQKQTTAPAPAVQPTTQANGVANGQSTLDTHMGGVSTDASRGGDVGVGAALGMGVGVGMGERQATNGASASQEVEAMEIDDEQRPGVADEEDRSRIEIPDEDGEDDDEEGSMHTANDEMEAEPAARAIMEES